MTHYPYRDSLLAVKHTTLREARRRRGLTQEQLEQASGVQQSVISRIERGDTFDPSWGTVTKLEDALGVRRGSLVFGDEAKLRERAS